MTLPTLDQVRTIAVIGAGTMGHGIAQVAAQAGMSVRIQDTLQGSAKGAIDRIAKNLAKGVELGKLATDDRDAALGRLSAFDEIVAAVGEADIIIEAVPEKLELKREIFSAVEKVASPNALFATNTSSLPIGELANDLKDPSRMVGMHFFNPVHLMKLVEVVRHKKAAEAAVTLAVALVEKLGKTAITVNDSPGFASSRLGIAIGLEAMRMVEEGVASAADIDTAMKLGYGHPMGPLELTDLVGLDVRLGIAEYLERALGPSFEPPAILIEKVAAGMLGKKTGAGFYKWGADGKKS
ncbi:MAG: 3-hydroxyacyl-CoA dehydrogenase family protein [Deltaproteobacteria bacterium]